MLPVEVLYDKIQYRVDMKMVDSDLPKHPGSGADGKD
jgi:hypothetical protein